MDASESQSLSKEKKEKDFQCACGKGYLSYPALYTHVKQAHGGNPPGPLKRPEVQMRGRPKAAGVQKYIEHKKSLETFVKEDPIVGLIQFLKSQADRKDKGLSIKAIYENQPVYKLIMQQKDKQICPKFLKEDQIYQVKMGEGIILFLRQLHEKIPEDLTQQYDQVLLLIVLLTEHIIEETEDQNVLSLGTIGLMPEFVNFFLIHDFRKPIERLGLRHQWLGQFDNVIKVFEYFFKWMVHEKYTLTKVTINQNYNFSWDSNQEQSNQEESHQEQSNQEQSKQEQSGPQKYSQYVAGSEEAKKENQQLNSDSSLQQKELLIEQKALPSQQKEQPLEQKELSLEQKDSGKRYIDQSNCKICLGNQTHNKKEWVQKVCQGPNQSQENSRAKQQNPQKKVHLDQC